MKPIKITLGVPVMNQLDLTLEFLDKIFDTTNSTKTNYNDSFQIMLVDNGSVPSLMEFLQDNRPEYLKQNLYIIRNQNNIGVREALNQIYEKASGEIVVYTHNDVMFYDIGWDNKIRLAFDKHKEAGIIGAYGAKGIGTADIYKAQYVMQQLARGGNVSNCRMDKNVHGFRNLDGKFENVAVFDGFFMAIKKELLDKTGGFSNILPQHHNYDNLICVQSLEHGYENIVISLDLDHLGGRTDVGENWSERFGKTKQEIHIDAHPPFYNYGKGKLPIFIEDIYDEKGFICGYQLHMDNKIVKEKIYE